MAFHIASIPGLGNATGLIDLGSDCMWEAANKDENIADFVKRAKNPGAWWIWEFLANADSFSRGCGW